MDTRYATKRKKRRLLSKAVLSDALCALVTCTGILHPCHALSWLSTPQDVPGVHPGRHTCVYILYDTCTAPWCVRRCISARRGLTVGTCLGSLTTVFMSWTFFTYALAEKYIVATNTYVRTQGCLLFPTAKKTGFCYLHGGPGGKDSGSKCEFDVPYINVRCLYVYLPSCPPTQLRFARYLCMHTYIRTGAAR